MKCRKNILPTERTDKHAGLCYDAHQCFKPVFIVYWYGIRNFLRGKNEEIPTKSHESIFTIENSGLMTTQMLYQTF